VNVGEIAAEVAQISTLALGCQTTDGCVTAPDAESAHLAEDGLYVWVLRAIADGECADPAACATAALMANAVRFAR
jgi:hypothetical protein